MSPVRSGRPERRRDTQLTMTRVMKARGVCSHEDGAG